MTQFRASGAGRRRSGARPARQILSISISISIHVYICIYMYIYIHIYTFTDIDVYIDSDTVLEFRTQVVVEAELARHVR